VTLFHYFSLVAGGQQDLEMKVATLESEKMALQRRLRDMTDKPGSHMDVKRYGD